MDYRSEARSMGGTALTISEINLFGGPSEIIIDHATISNMQQ